MAFSPLAILLVALPCASGFSGVLFQKAPTLQSKAPSKTCPDTDFELPDFDELFNRIQKVSPLARQVIQGGEPLGFNCIDEASKFYARILNRSFELTTHCLTVCASSYLFLRPIKIGNPGPSDLKWQTVEKKPGGVVHQIDKIDNFQGRRAPILRFRSTLAGPCFGEAFGNFLMDLDMRKTWDDQIEQVYELHPIQDLDYANIAMGFGRYGDCQKLGVGYCQTKANKIINISPREQLTLCGIQNFSNGAAIIWGTEMEEWHNHMLPGDVRHTRAKSHLFCITLTPTSPSTFDVEYALQLDIGGKLPTWITTPVVTENVKKMFRTCDSWFRNTDGSIDEFLKRKEA
jgi:hypothetical protein